MPHKISIIAVTYNSLKYLPDLIDSIFNQTYFSQNQITPDIFIVDNASTDGSPKFIRDHYPTVHLLKNVNNIGLSRAWNQAIQMTRGEYILILNPDIILDKSFVAHALKAVQSDQTIASLGGKLLQFKLESINQDELPAVKKTSTIDSCGLKALKNRRFVERGGAQPDTGQFNSSQDVFGLSGACVLYRRSALEQIKFNREYFDEDFFIYQEDIDLAWRLRLAGYTALYLPQALAYHHRRARSEEKTSLLATLKRRRQKEDYINYYSYRNHLLLLYKNSLSINFFLHFPYIFLYELKKFLYVLLLENSTLRRTIPDLFRLRRKMKQKRHFNLRLKRLKAKEIRQWFE